MSCPSVNQAMGGYSLSLHLFLWLLPNCQVPIYNPCSTCMFLGKKWNTGIRIYGFGCLPTEFTKVLLFDPQKKKRKKKRFPPPLLPSSPLPTFSEYHWFVCLFLFRDVLENSQWSGHRWGLSFHHLFSTPPPSATPNASPVGNTFSWKNCGCGDGGEDFSTSEMKAIVRLCWFKLVCIVQPVGLLLQLGAYLCKLLSSVNYCSLSTPWPKTLFHVVAGFKSCFAGTFFKDCGGREEMNAANALPPVAPQVPRYPSPVPKI